MGKMVQNIFLSRDDVSGLLTAENVEQAHTDSFMELPLAPQKKLKKKCCKKYQRKGRYCKSCPKAAKNK